MLAERFAVIAEDDPERPAIQSAILQSAAQRPERRVGVMERVAIPAELVAVGKRTALRRFIGMMARNRQIRHHERMAGALLVDPAQDARDR